MRSYRNKLKIIRITLQNNCVENYVVIFGYKCALKLSKEIYNATRIQ